jgi:hypothetical protein
MSWSLRAVEAPELKPFPRLQAGPDVFRAMTAFPTFAAAMIASLMLAGAAHAQTSSPAKPPDARDEFVRRCVPRMEGRWAHPEAVCDCLHDRAAAAVEDHDLRQALLRGISETGVPTIESDWVPPSKQSEISATFTKIAKPTLQCMFGPQDPKQ